MKNLTNWSEIPLTLTAKHVSKILGLSMPLTYHLLNQEGFPSIKISEKRKIVPKDQLKLWLEKQTSKMEAPLND